jgi:2-amino-4-hydroxy-6-hydroxymethyldihydropteridine diphosphokinase
MPTCWIALGGNLGPVRDTFERAFERLAGIPAVRLTAVSLFHRTAPMGADAGAAFLNAAAGLETNLGPLELLELLLSIEDALGRVRTRHWGPRTLDLDLLLYGEEICRTPRLTLPHPHLWYRRFVLDPLAEIAEHVVHPVKRLTIGQLRARLLGTPFRCQLAGGAAELRGELLDVLRREFPRVVWSRWDSGAELAEFADSAAADPALVLWLGPPDDAPASGGGFESLPLVPRLDISGFAEPVPAIGDILGAALGS